jgi:hypothetical protein
MMVYIYQRQNLTVPSVFQATARKHPARVCLYFEEESWTFKQVRKIKLASRYLFFFFLSPWQIVMC